MCRQLGITEEEMEAIKESYGVTSSRNLSEAQLAHLIDRLISGQNFTQTPDDNASKWRKRVMAAVGAWLRQMNKDEGSEVIKAIVCRATGYKSFNRIPVSRLRAVYYEFLNKGKTADAARLLKKSITDYLEMSN